MAVTAFNTTEKAARLDLEISTEGGIRSHLARASLEVGPNEKRSVDIPVSATGEIGAARSGSAHRLSARRSLWRRNFPSGVPRRI